MERAILGIQHDLAQPQSDVHALCNVPQRQPDAFSPARHHSSTDSCQGLRSENFEMLSRRSKQSPKYPEPAISKIIFVHTLDLARSRLEAIGLVPSRSDIPKEGPAEQTGSAGPAPHEIMFTARSILALGRRRIDQLVAVYETEVHPMHPCIDMEVFQAKLSQLLNMSYSYPLQEELRSETLEYIDIEICKAVLGIGQNLEIPSQSDVEPNLFDQIIWSPDALLSKETADIEDLILAVLQIIYFICKQDLRKAWRVCGVAARTCLELGLHRETNMEASQEALLAHTLFCCVYDLDSKCTSICYLPRAMNKQVVAAPVARSVGFSSSLLDAMIRLGQVVSDIHCAVNSADSLREYEPKAEFLEFRIQSVLKEVANDENLSELMTRVPLHMQRSMNALIKIRGNHMRLLLQLRSVVLSANLNSRTKQLQSLVAISKETVAEGLQVHAGGRLSAVFHASFDVMLMAALSSMFLAASFNSTEYGVACREAFHTAINLLNLSAFKVNSKVKMWCSLEDLRRLATKIKMPPPDTYINQPEVSQTLDTNLAFDLFSQPSFPAIDESFVDWFHALGPLTTSTFLQTADLPDDERSGHFQGDSRFQISSQEF
ncbi:hypothetical protein EJ08DRAFT_417124 [Tothia fuscella]|uniref:Xylanolytic transcriptional activator regulatory domain-containing protein n=1 Tax=Tothia fuscella TaxID=1048955 RepID=A0A9P4NJY3_9PEZI|nr:hypothetical protein EJ08DRAFT_417124 [Tothia fuscella]